MLTQMVTGMNVCKTDRHRSLGGIFVVGIAALLVINARVAGQAYGQTAAVVNDNAQDTLIREG